jgi:hypothetical protein
MVRSGRVAALSVWLVLLGTAGCDSGGTPTDGGGELNVTITCPHGVGKNTSTDLANPLALDTDAAGYICPARHNEYFKIQHTGSLLSVDLKFAVADSKVKLTYLVLDDKGVMKASAPSWTGAGARHFQDLHCLTAGTYFIQVKDESNDGYDGQNQFHLKVGSLQDKDTNEPGNNTVAGAKAPGQGYISCKGDLDWFTLSVGADQMAQVTLTTAATSQLVLAYEIWDSTGKATKYGEGFADGTKGPINLAALHCLPKAGSYAIVVKDKDGTHSDSTVPYTLAISQQNEQDAQDKGARNDTPATATNCGANCTFTGQIGCKGDVDYYKVDLSGITGTNIGVVEISVDFGSKAKVQPQAAVIFGDEKTACTKDSCCQVLSKSCMSNDVDCARLSYQCVHKSDTVCNDKDCTPTATCATEQACAGASFCLPGKVCAGEQVARTSTDGIKVVTAQPLLHPGPFYIRVGDDRNDEYDYGHNYTVTIKAVADPDGAKELNSEYFPNMPGSNVDTTIYHRKAADAKPPVTLTVGGNVTISGNISYAGDQDWYLLKPPGAACGAKNECTLTVNFSSSGNCGSLKPSFGLYRESGREPWFSWPGEKSPWVMSGNPGCVYVNSASDYYFVVWSFGHDAWSWSCPYSVTISTAAGCNPPCKVSSGNCDFGP